MTTVRRALAISMGERYVLIGIALIGNMLLARLLTPEEIGIYSVSLAVIGIAQVMRDFGIGNFLIQEKNLNDAHIRTAFGISLLIGCLLFLVIFFGAPWSGSFYGETRMVETMRISSLNFLVLPFCTISLALLRRDMLFNRLVTVTLIAAFAGFAVTISLAYTGYGPNSMAIGAVATNIATGMGAWLARTNRKLLLPSFTEWRVLLNFGGQSAVANVVTTVAMDINDLALGKILGFSPVAMLSRAQGLMNLFHRDIMSAIRNVAYPAIANAYRQEDDLEPRHTHAVACVTGFAWPYYAFVGLFAVDVLRLMFGAQWDEAAPLVGWFCLAGAAAASCNLVTSLLMAIGRIDLVTKLELIIQPTRAVIIVLAVLYFRSVEAAAVAFAIVFTGSVFVIYMFKGVAIRTDWHALFNSLGKSLAVTIICILIPASLNLHLRGPDGATSSPILFMAAVIVAIAWFFALRIVDHPLSREPLYMRIASLLPFSSVRRYFLQERR